MIFSCLYTHDVSVIHHQFIIVIQAQKQEILLQMVGEKEEVIEQLEQQLSEVRESSMNKICINL